MRVHPKQGEAWDAELTHTYNDEQIEWFKHGSAFELHQEQILMSFLLMFIVFSIRIFS